MPPLSLYIHIPWCIRKCPYCDFNSHAVKNAVAENQYVQALLVDLHSDIKTYGIKRPINSIFLGGGTPSLFSPESIDLLVSGIKKQVVLLPDAEITLEANPSTFEAEKFAGFRQAGINRLSIGVQSFNDAILEKIGRVHSANEAIKTAEMARVVGFENFNIDLMFGLPSADLKSSFLDVETAIKLNPTHISFYQLTLEPNTYFYRFPPKLPDDELTFAIQQQGQNLLEKHDYFQYEVSAYSKPEKQCKHNINYWQFGDYLGIGAGAHGKITENLPDKIYRTQKPKHPENYLKNQLGNVNTLSKSDLPIEFLMNHLRLKKGFDLAHYEKFTGLNRQTIQPILEKCVLEKLLVSQNEHYHCSEKGWLFLDTILQKFLP